MMERDVLNCYVTPEFNNLSQESTYNTGDMTTYTCLS